MSLLDRINKLAGWPEQDEYAKTVNRSIASKSLTLLIVSIDIEIICAYFFLSPNDFRKVAIALLLPQIPMAIVAAILRWKFGMLIYNREMVNRNAAKKKKAVIGLMVSSLIFSGSMVYEQYSWAHSSFFESVICGIIGGILWGGAMYWVLMRKRKSEDEPISEKSTQ